MTVLRNGRAIASYSDKDVAEYGDAHDFHRAAFPSNNYETATDITPAHCDIIIEEHSE